MSKDAIIIYSIFFVGAFFSFYHYIKIKNKIKSMQEIKATCTDVIIRTTYNKKYYMYFYTFKLDGTCNISDKRRTPLMRNKIKINEEYIMYVNPKNDKDYVTPIETMTNNFYLFLSIALIILPCLFLR